jgi:hypothetical protein
MGCERATLRESTKTLERERSNEMTDEERIRRTQMMVGAIAVEIDGELLNALGDIAGRIPDEDLKERLAAYVVITALASDSEQRRVEVSAAVMISLLVEIRRWRERYPEPSQPVQ